MTTADPQVENAADIGQQPVTALPAGVQFPVVLIDDAGDRWVAYEGDPIWHRANRRLPPIGVDLAP